MPDEVPPGTVVIEPPPTEPTDYVVPPAPKAAA